MNQRIPRAARLAAGLLVPHTVVVLVQRSRQRRRVARLVRRAEPPVRSSRQFDYEDAVALLIARGVDEEIVRVASIGRSSMRFVASLVERNSPRRPLRALHVGNFVGVSLAALSDVLARHDRDSVIVSVDPNLTHLGVEDPQSHALALLAEFGLERGNVVVCGYSLEATGAAPGGEEVLPGLERAGARFDLALIDGNHDSAYLRREVEVLARLLEPAALLFLDDVSPAYPDVRALFEELAADADGPFENVARDERLGVLRRRG